MPLQRIHVLESLECCFRAPQLVSYLFVYVGRRIVALLDVVYSFELSFAHLDVVSFDVGAQRVHRVQSLVVLFVSVEASVDLVSPQVIQLRDKALQAEPWRCSYHPVWVLRISGFDPANSRRDGVDLACTDPWYRCILCQIFFLEFLVSLFTLFFSYLV